MSEQRDKEVEAVYDAHQEKLFGFARGMGLSYHDAEDVVNDCFEVIWRYWDRLRDENLRAFLYTVAKHEIYHKRSYRRSRRPEDLLAKLPTVTTGDFAQQVADRRRCVRPSPHCPSENEKQCYCVTTSNVTSPKPPRSWMA